MNSSIDKIQDFLNQQGFDENYQLELITNSASQRMYARIRENEKSVIATFSENIKENETFLYYSEMFQQSNFNVAKILAVSEDKTTYLQEDLGDTNLLQLIENKDAKLPIYLQTIMQDLARMQTDLAKEIDFSKAYEFSNFDERIILNDLFYFKNYFLEYLEIPFPKQALIDDFFALTNEAKTLPNDFFMYRDFQSRNIMIYNETSYYIDFQGGMKGITAYDCVSFSWQAKANFDEATKTQLKELYFKAMKENSNISDSDLEASYQLSLVLRLFQLLGAYGFRGLVQQKKHFKESIYNTLNNIQTITNWGYLDKYPTLKSLSTNFLTTEKINL